MTLPFRFHKETFFIFLAGSALFFLSSRYFGGIYIRLSRFWFTFFTADILILLINSLTLRFSLDYSSDHMSKGDRVEYRISIQGGSLFPASSLLLELAQVHHSDTGGGEKIRFSLRPGETWTYRREVHARLRGVYTMGISRLRLKSFSGLLSIDLAVRARNFYVYPRVFEIPELLLKHPSPGGVTGSREGSHGDEHNFLGLREYREGESLKDISWSRFMQTGRPLIKIWSSAGGDRIHLYLDRRPSKVSPLCDDTILEVFLCLVRSGLSTGQRMVLHGFPGWEGRSVLTMKDFDNLYRSTLLLEFDAPGLGELNSLEKLENVYAVSGMPDLSLLDENSRYASLGHLVAVTLDRSDEELERLKVLLLQRTGRGGYASEIRSDRNLEEELLWQLYS